MNQLVVFALCVFAASVKGAALTSSSEEMAMSDALPTTTVDPIQKAISDVKTKVFGALAPQIAAAVPAAVEFALPGAITATTANPIKAAIDEFKTNLFGATKPAAPFDFTKVIAAGSKLFANLKATQAAVASAATGAAASAASDAINAAGAPTAAAAAASAAPTPDIKAAIATHLKDFADDLTQALAPAPAA